MNRLSFVLVSMLVACGGGGDDGGGGTITPTGPHHQYVVSKANVPTTAAQVTQFGLDLGAPKTNKQDGQVDNALGTTLSTLSLMKIDVQGGIDTAVNNGSIILLVDVQTESFDSSNAAGMKVSLGDNPTPAPCTDDADPTTCGQHLKGTGMFSIAANSPSDAALAGTITGGTFDGGPGDVTLQISLGEGAPITLALHGARAEVTGITDTGIATAKIGGAVTESDINGQVIPAVQAQVMPIITRDCPDAVAPACMCTAGTTTGPTVLKLLDTDHDCKVTVAEIQSNSLIKSLLGPDVCVEESCEKPDALSIGIQATAVAATF